MGYILSATEKTKLKQHILNGDQSSVILKSFKGKIKIGAINYYKKKLKEQGAALPNIMGRPTQYVKIKVPINCKSNKTPNTSTVQEYKNSKLKIFVDKKLISEKEISISEKEITFCHHGYSVRIKF